MHSNAPRPVDRVGQSRSIWQSMTIKRDVAKKNWVKLTFM
jgi:hypothetical protein